MRVQDGKGRGFEAEVNEEQELVVRSIVESELEHASSLGNAYTWDSTELDIDAGDTMLYVRNDSDTPLICDRLEINGSNVICTWEIGLGTASTAPAGTTVTGANINTRFASDAPDATSFSDETAVADATVRLRAKTPVSGLVSVNLDGIIITKNHYIQINQETESTSGSVILVAHFENPS